MSLAFFKRNVASSNTRSTVGSFATGAAGAVGAIRGSGFTVAKTGAGRYTVTLSDPPRVVLSAVASIGVTAASAFVAQIGPVGAGNSTIDLFTVSGGAATDLVNGSVNFYVEGKY